MQFISLTLLALSCISTALDSPSEPGIANLIPRETWKAWKRDNILQGGGWPLYAAQCPLLTTQCDSLSCCPNSLLCTSTSGAYDTRDVCCPDKQDCSTALASTPFCADDSWDLWETDGGNVAYFCCLPGQIGLQTEECVSGKQAVVSSLYATSLGIVTAGAVFQSGTQTTASGSAATSQTVSGSSVTATVTNKATKTISGGSIESSIVSIASGIAHSGGNDGKKGVAAYAVEGILGAIVAAFL